MFNHVMIWGSLLWYFVLDNFYNYIIRGPYVGSLAKAIYESTFWLTTLLTVIILMVPLLAWRFYNITCNPSLADKIRLKQREMKHIKSKPIIARTASARRSRRSLRSSYAFAHEVNFYLHLLTQNCIIDFNQNSRKDLVDLSHRVKLCESFHMIFKHIH